MKPLFFKYFAFLSFFAFCSSVNFCEKKPQAPVADWSMFLNQSCYFTVVNATDSSTITEWSLWRHEVVFNITNAREMCSEHGGTLPIINSEEENRFVTMYDSPEFMNEYGERNIFRMVLGMQRQSSNEYHWDDGTLVSYEPEQGWERKIKENDCTVLRRQAEDPIWFGFPCRGIGIGRLGVLCKKVINPDCQYVLKSSNSSCTWDDLDKKCYEKFNIEILAPELKGGKECPENGLVDRECACKAMRDQEHKENQNSNGCGQDPNQKPCPLPQKSKTSTGSDTNGGAKMIGNLLLIAAITIKSIFL